MRTFAIIGGLLVGMLVAALIAPLVVDWSNFRTDFEREASRLLGQPVSVAGGTSARLLPWPKVEFEDVSIGSGAQGEPLLRLDGLALDVEIAPLLRGDVRIVEMQLDRPSGRVRIAQSGRIDWLGGGDALRLPPSDVSIERLVVREGDLTLVDDARSASVALTGIDAELTADTLAGPWRGEGGFTLGGERYAASGTTGAVRRENGASRIATRLSVRPASLPYEFTATGPVTIEGSNAVFDGAFSIAPAAEEGEPAPAPVFADGAMRLDRRRLDLPGFIVRIGEGDDPYRLEGRAQAFFEGDSRYDLRLRGAQVDADRLAAPEGSADGEDASAAARLDALAALLRRVPRPSLPGLITLDLPAIVAGDTVVRELRARVRPLADGTGWQVERFRARLPGRTLLETSGRLELPRDGAPNAAGMGFKGRVLLASRQPSGLAAWLSGSVDDAIRRLGTAGLEADVTMGGGTARFDDLELRLGDDLLRGTLARLGAEGAARPRILANLQGSHVDVDALRAMAALFSGRDAAEGDVVAHDLDVRMAVARLSALGLTAQDVEVTALYENDDLVVDRLQIGNVEGLSGELRGRISDLYRRPSGALSGRVAVEEPAKVVALARSREVLSPFGAHFAREPTLLAGTELDFSFDAKRAGLESDFRLDLDGTLGTSRLRATALYQGELSQADPRVELVVRADSDRPITLLRQLGLRPVGVELAGPAELLVRLDGRPGGLEVETSLGTPDGRVATQGRTRFVAGRGDVYEGRFELAGRDVDPLLAASGLAVPGLGTGTPIELAGSIEVDADEVGVNDVRGQVRGVPVRLSLVLDTQTAPRPSLDGEIALGSLDLVTLVRSVLGPTFDPARFGVAEERPLGEPLLSGLDGSIELTAESAELGLGLLPAAPATGLRADLEISDGDFTFEDLSASWLGGRLSGTAAIAKAARNGVVGVDLRLENANLVATGLVDAQTPRVSGRFDLEIAVEAQGATDQQLASRLAGGATVRLHDIRLKGFAPNALPELLAAADEVPDEALERRAPGLAARRILEGEASVAPVAVPFTVANGVARASGVGLEIEGVETVVDLRVDLAAGTFDGTLRGTLPSPADGPVVAGIAPDYRIDFERRDGAPSGTLDATTLTTYLTTRLRERREREFEAQRAAILERQRLVRAMRLSRERERRDRARLREREEKLPG